MPSRHAIGVGSRGVGSRAHDAGTTTRAPWRAPNVRSLRVHTRYSSRRKSRHRLQPPGSPAPPPDTASRAILLGWALSRRIQQRGRHSPFRNMGCNRYPPCRCFDGLPLRYVRSRSHRPDTVDRSGMENETVDPRLELDMTRFRSAFALGFSLLTLPPLGCGSHGDGGTGETGEGSPGGSVGMGAAGGGMQAGGWSGEVDPLGGANAGNAGASGSAGGGEQGGVDGGGAGHSNAGVGGNGDGGVADNGGAGGAPYVSCSQVMPGASACYVPDVSCMTAQDCPDLTTICHDPKHTVAYQLHGCTPSGACEYSVSTGTCDFGAMCESTSSGATCFGQATGPGGVGGGPNGGTGGNAGSGSLQHMNQMPSPARLRIVDGRALFVPLAVIGVPRGACCSLY
jgi:hypothetical protein